MEQKRIILFGCGTLGHEALHFLGEDNVICFCDNSAAVADYHGDGKKNVISFDELKKEYRENIVILCTVNDNAIYDMAKQCEENGVYDYIVYETAREMAQDRETLLNYIDNPENRMRMRKQLWSNRIRMLEIQVDFFKKHADIRHMKPAQGRLRERQLACVQAAKECLDKISFLGIKPFLIEGNLIGYVRHGGFIPWDDDMDFGLIRSEFERLKEYCRENLYTWEEFNEKEKKGTIRDDVADGMEDYCWACYPSNFVIFCHAIPLDFYVYDYYADDFPFDTMRRTANEIREELKTVISLEGKLQYLESEKKKNLLHTVDKSSQIYFGIDSAELNHRDYQGGYIPENVVFPLRKVLWEGESFWVPNNAEALLNYEYESFWDIPDDAGMPKHFKSLGIKE